MDWIKSLLGGGKPKGYEELEDKEFQQKLKGTKKKVILDVRHKHEFDKEKIHQAMNMDIMHPGFEEKIKHFDPQKTYFVYCQSGRRGRKACKKLADLGFTQVYNLKGGILSYTGKTV